VCAYGYIHRLYIYIYVRTLVIMYGTASLTIDNSVLPMKSHSSDVTTSLDRKIPSRIFHERTNNKKSDDNNYRRRSSRVQSH
jgi:hypothetical protein